MNSKDSCNEKLNLEEIDISKKYLKSDGEPNKIRKFSESITQDPLRDTLPLETDHLAFRDNMDLKELHLTKLEAQRSQVFFFCISN